MTRPVRPIALVILTACMIYPGVTLLYQGVYPFVTGEYFNLVAQLGVWMTLAQKLHVSPVLVTFLKTGLGAAWVAGVLGLWAGAPPAQVLASFAKGFGNTLADVGMLLALGAMFGELLASSGGADRVSTTLLKFGGPIFFREDPEQVPA